MKCIVYLIIITTVSVNGEFNQNFRQSKATVSTVCTESTISNTFCASDGCGSNELILCLGPNFGVSVNCSAQYPYCVENIAGKAECTESCGSDFVCTGEGIYPDPEDCKKYHFCKKVNNVFTSQLYSCPDRYVFDPDSSTTNYCRYTNNFYCTLPKCGNSDQMKNVLFLYPFYPYNRQFFIFCIPNIKPIVYKCQDGYVADLSTFPATCNFKCKSVGLFPNPDDSTKYFECYYNSKHQLVMRPGSCFSGYVFIKDRCLAQSTTVQTTTQSTISSSIQTDSTSQAPTQSEIESTSSVPTQSKIESTSSVPTQSEIESTSSVPTQSEIESTSSASTQSEIESTSQDPANQDSTQSNTEPSQIQSESTSQIPESTTEECIKPPCN